MALAPSGKQSGDGQATGAKPSHPTAMAFFVLAIGDQPMRTAFATCLAGLHFALLLAGCGGPEERNQGSTAQPARQIGVGPIKAALQSSAGSSAGTVTLNEDSNGVTVDVLAKGLTGEAHAVHIHAIGKCDVPRFESAGPHWNPANRKHGRDNPEGAHLGDLANLQVAADGSGRSTFAIAGARLTDGSSAMLDGDGAALVIHAKADDYMTDPSGNSGDRIACAVLKA